MKTAFFRLTKTALLTAFMFIAFTMSAFAKPTDVSKYLVKQFQKQFQQAANVAWKTTDQFTSATFTLDGNNMIVFYNPQNDLIGVSKTITLQDLPITAVQAINMKYGNDKIVSVINFTDAEGISNYYIQIESNNRQIILKSDDQGYLSNYQK